MSSPPRRRQRIGLSNPRAARGEANQAEQREAQREAEEQYHRLALNLAASVVGLEVPFDDEDRDEFNLDSDNSLSQGSIENDDNPQAPPPPAAVRPLVPPPVANQAIAAAPRNRALWQGNDAKLNIVAGRYLMQPGRQEMQAMASNNADRIAEIRQLKRDPNRDFGHDNYKHSSLSFLVRKTCEELNSDVTFVQNYLPLNFVLSEELLRQKINQFMQIAIATNVGDIDPRNCLFYVLMHIYFISFLDYIRAKYEILSIIYEIFYFKCFISDRQQWKLDLRTVHEKQQQQIRAIEQDHNSGVHNRQVIDDALGGLLHPPGIERNLQIEAINGRVLSQGGRVIARERQAGIIPQVQSPARVPATVARAPAIVMNNIQRGGQDFADDPFLSALMRGHSAQSLPPASHNFKVQQEARSIELKNLKEQYNFVKDLPDNFRNKEELLSDILDRIVGESDPGLCPICKDSLMLESFVARFPCCMQQIHTACLVGLVSQVQPLGMTSHRCPICRADL